MALQVAVVGAGPAGLATAIFLRRAGHDVRVFERFDKPGPVGSGLILQPTGLTVLDRLGLLGDIRALGARIDRLRGTDARSGRMVLDVRYDALRGGRYGLAVHRAALFGVLHQAAIRDKISIETATEIRELDHRGGKTALVRDDGRKIGTFDLVVDASGARSRLRRFAANPSEPKVLPYGAFWASLEWRDGFDPNALTQRYDRASVMIGVLPIGCPYRDAQPMAAFFWSLKPDDVPLVKRKGIDAWKESIISMWPEVGAFVHQIRDFQQLSVARYGHHTLKTPAGRGLAIVGDAAHSTSPQLGQGANMALLDAAALSHAVSTNSSIADMLDAYCLARRRHVRVFQAMSLLFTPFYQSDSALLPFVRDRIVALVAKVPPAPQILASMVAGTIVDPFGPAGLTESVWD